MAKIKVLYGKKPVGDAKTLQELLGDEQPDQVELGLMIMGGAASVVPREPKEKNSAGGPGSGNGPKMSIDERLETSDEKAHERDVQMRDANDDGCLPSTAVGVHGKEALITPEFWDDLKGFLQQRLRDEHLGHEVADRFKQSLVGGI